MLAEIQKQADGPERNRSEYCHEEYVRFKNCEKANGDLRQYDKD